MSDHGLTAENLLASLPLALRQDSSMAALAEAVAGVLARRREEVNRLLLYAHIEAMDGPLLDILAQDFKVDWWDPDYGLEEKRRTLRDGWQVHRMLGTKAAVERAISAVYRDTKVREWFEYGGDPYHFKLQIEATYEDVDPEKHQRVLKRMEFYKNLRSHLDGVEYIVHPEARPAAYVGTIGAGIHLELSVHLDNRLTVGGRMPLGIGISTVCLTGRLCARLKVYGDVAPRAVAAAGAGIGVCGAKIKIYTEVKINDVE